MREEREFLGAAFVDWASDLYRVANMIRVVICQLKVGLDNKILWTQFSLLQIPLYQQVMTEVQYLKKRNIFRWQDMDFLGSLRRLSSRFICQKILITTVASERMLASGREMLVANWWEGNVIKLISYSLSSLLQKVCFLGPVSEVQPFLVFLFATWYRVTLHIPMFQCASSCL